MKSIFILSILLTFGFSAARCQASLDAENGFRGMTFGTPIDSFHDLKLTEDYGDTKFYKKENEDNNIGGSEVTEIDYGFYKGRFYTVVIKTEGGDNSHAVLNAMRQKYGNGDRLKRHEEKYEWKGSKVAMRYLENELTNDAVTTLYDINLRDQRNREDKGSQYKDVGADD